MEGKNKQRVCIKFCVKLSKSAIETTEILREAFGKHSLSWTGVSEYDIHVSRPVECQFKMTNVQGYSILYRWPHKRPIA
jgi:hypothetical protein